MVNNSFSDCLKRKIIKTVSVERTLLKSLERIAEEKIKASKQLSQDLQLVKISLLYDALREYLEIKALEKGFKIYNHECYIPFINEILRKTLMGEQFNIVRKARNAINYYGKKI